MILHADRGSSMKSYPVAQLLADLGVTNSHSRPRVSNDNPFSESQFKTLKYRPNFPSRFAGYEHAKEFCGEFLPWYNHQHMHSSICYLSPAAVYYGLATQLLDERNRLRRLAGEAHPGPIPAGSAEASAFT